MRRFSFAGEIRAAHPLGIALALLFSPGCLEQTTVQSAYGPGLDDSVEIKNDSTKFFATVATPLQPAFVFFNGSEFPGAKGSLQQLPPTSGDSVQTLSYNFSQGGRYVASLVSLPAPVAAGYFRFSVSAPLDIRVVLRVVDESSQTLQFAIDRRATPLDEFGWSTHSIDLNKPSAFWGGKKNGILNGRVVNVGLIVDSNASRSSGVAHFKHLRLSAVQPTPSLAIDAIASTPISGAKFYNGGEFPGATGNLAVVPPAVLDTTQVLNFDLTAGGRYVASIHRLPAPAPATYIRYALKAPAATKIRLRVIDQTGQTLQFTPDRTLSFADDLGWSVQTAKITSSAAHWGGANDGLLHGNVTQLWLIAEQPGAAGIAYFRDIQFLQSNPEFTKVALQSAFQEMGKAAPSAAVFEGFVTAMKQGKTLLALRTSISTIESYYRDILGRTSLTDSGSNSWVLSLFSGRSSAMQIRAGMVASSEARNAVISVFRSMVKYEPSSTVVDRCLEAIKLGKSLAGLRESLAVIENAFLGIIGRSSLANASSAEWVVRHFSGATSTAQLRSELIDSAEGRTNVRRSLGFLLLMAPTDSVIELCVLKLKSSLTLHVRECLKDEFLAMAPRTGPSPAKPAGVNTHGGYGGLAAERMPQLGLTTARTDLTWSALQRAANTPSCSFAMPAGLSSYLSLMASRGISNLGILDYGNPDCGFNVIREVKTPAGAVIGTEIYLGIDTAAENAFVEYVKFVATSLKGTVKRYELWNEWDVPLLRSAQALDRAGHTALAQDLITKSAQAYVHLLQRTFAALRLIDPTATLLAGAVDAAGDFRFLDALLAAKVTSYSNGLSVHIYHHTLVHGDAETWASTTMRIAERVRNLNGGLEFPIYMTELGWPSYLGLAAYADNPELRGAAQSVIQEASSLARNAGQSAQTILNRTVAELRQSSLSCTAAPTSIPDLSEVRALAESLAPEIKTETENLSAQLSSRAAFLTPMIPELKELMFYDLGDDGKCPYEVEHHFGLVDIQSPGRPNKPAAHFIQEALSTIRGKMFLGRLFVGDENIFVLRYGSAGSPETWVVWARGNPKPLRLLAPAGAISKKEIGLPATVLSGSETHLIIGGRPMIVSGDLRSAQLCSETTPKCVKIP